MPFTPYQLAQGMQSGTQSGFLSQLLFQEMTVKVKSRARHYLDLLWGGPCKALNGRGLGKGGQGGWEREGCVRG